MVAASMPAADPSPVASSTVAQSDVTSSLPTPDDAPIVGYNPPVTSVASSSSSDSATDLSTIKKEALSDLRPLVDKLDIAADEKFDTYLLLIRSTDDKTLIAPAYAAAQAITDEARKAQALLDVIKEIDYLSNPK
jgi:hypothetical protein